MAVFFTVRNLLSSLPVSGCLQRDFWFKNSLFSDMLHDKKWLEYLQGIV